jgi:hypothetical protein
VVNFTCEVIPREIIASETSRDSLLQGILDHPTKSSRSSASQKEQPFKRISKSLTTAHGCILYGDRFVIPDALKERCIDIAHQTHARVNATYEILQRQCWRPNVRDSIRKKVENGGNCADKTRHFTASDATSKWKEGYMPSERVHMDFAQCEKIPNKLMILLVDAFSGWPECYVVPNRSIITLRHWLRRFFATFGVPLTTVSDNAAEFVAIQPGNR